MDIRATLRPWHKTAFNVPLDPTRWLLLVNSAPFYVVWGDTIGEALDEARSVLSGE